VGDGVRRRKRKKRRKRVRRKKLKKLKVLLRLLVLLKRMVDLLRDWGPVRDGRVGMRLKVRPALVEEVVVGEELVLEVVVVLEGEAEVINAVRLVPRVGNLCSYEKIKCPWEFIYANEVPSLFLLILHRA
jgi:hypothetical protein